MEWKPFGPVDPAPTRFKDRDGDTWYRVQGSAEMYCDQGPYCMCAGSTLSGVDAAYGPLTDFEYDEPRKPEPFKDGEGDTWYPHTDGVKYCMDGDCPAAKSLAAASDALHGQTRSDVESTYGIAPEPTPRKPEPGDRVRVTYEAEYRGETRHGHRVRWLDGSSWALPADAEITVVERAAPKVPEEPEACNYVTNDAGEVFQRHGTAWFSLVTGNKVINWAELWSTEGPLYRVERGAVIGDA